MPERGELVAEIHRLIDEQMRALAGKLSPEEALVYARRTERLEELINRLSSGDFHKS